MKKIPVFLLLAIFLSACQTEHVSQEQNFSDFELALHKEDAVQFERLVLYPVLASNEMIRKNEGVREFITLKEAIKQARFRITEKKPFGRFEDQDAVGTLTVQNKTQESVLLMSGDLVQGGRQDRILAENKIIQPKTITDISVFCVESGRWNYHDNNSGTQADQPSEKGKKIFAFRGYYHVASSQIRKSINYSSNQEEVWQEVNHITSKNEAGSQTNSYAALEDAEHFTQQRDNYLDVFKDAFGHLENIIGVVAVSGSEILSTDIFGHPSLFRKQYESLLHSYITDAITLENLGTYSEERLKLYSKKIQDSYQNGGKGSNKLIFNGSLVYFSAM